MSWRVVLDTNVLVSANLNDSGLEALVVSLALTGHLRLFVSEPILLDTNACWATHG